MIRPLFCQKRTETGLPVHYNRGSNNSLCSHLEKKKIVWRHKRTNVFNPGDSAWTKSGVKVQTAPDVFGSSVVNKSPGVTV